MIAPRITITCEAQVEPIVQTVELPFVGKQYSTPQRQVGRQVQPPDHVHETVPDKDGDNLAKAAELPWRGPGDRPHSDSLAA
jgi:hypothetical protein